jgi:DNA mismatch endonuclease, patch repair protein
MTDIVSRSKRREMMSGIRGKDTKPELVVRSLLHKRGYRFRLHAKNLPGKPDLVMAKWRTVIFVNGCFWHGHSGCPLFSLPKTRTVFWSAKIQSNTDRDRKNYAALQNAGWKIIVVWECAISKKLRLGESFLADTLRDAINSSIAYVEIRGK